MRLRRLPERRLADCIKEKVRVGPSSTVRIRHNTYSVHSRLIKEWVEARIYAGHIEIWYGQKKMEILLRLRGEEKHRIDYRHIIDWLVRKPGAFENYRYRDDLFPGSSFRIAYDNLSDNHVQGVAGKEYLKILHLAAMEGESAVEGALRGLLRDGEPINIETVKGRVFSDIKICTVKDVQIEEVDLVAYDDLFDNRMQEAAYG
jgi:hypothetical protein